MNTVQSILFRWLDWLPKIIFGRERCSARPVAAWISSRVGSETGAAAQSRTVRLRSDETARLNRDSDFRQIEVRRGMIWLTGTPARGDVLLQRGDRFHFTDDWPFVLQAMGETEIILR